MIYAGISELRSAFHQHAVAGKHDSAASRQLLRFYAVECGLKSVYLQRNNLRTTEQAEILWNHDLGNLAKELRLPASLAGQAPNFHLRRDHTCYPVSQAHQAWRYGVAINPGDEQILRRWLDQIHDWIRREI